MAKVHRVALGGETFHARSGERLLDAALAQGVGLPHDCRAGRCGSCLTRVCSGITLGGETRTAGMVHACQAMVFSDLAIEIEPLPPVVRVGARVQRVTDMADGIVEVVLEPQRPVAMLPGQYCRFRFRGYPPRPFSPTATLDGSREDGCIRLHIKRVRDGALTPHLGRDITSGHSVGIEGPFGQAFLRPGLTRRLVAVGSGTGFAPVWAVVAAALRENSRRPVVVLAVSRTASAFYMGPALRTAAHGPNVTVAGIVEDPASLEEMLLRGYGGGLLAGPAVDRLPPLAADDIVYAAGGPRLVDAVATRATAAGAAFFADPFEPAGPTSRSWLDSAKAWIGAA